MAKFFKFQHVLEPYAHQRKSFEQTRELEYYGLFWEMGTGKTKPLIDTISWLFLNRQIDGALIVSDKGAYLNWPLEEIPKHMQPDLLKHVRFGIFKSGARGHEVRDYEGVLAARDDTLDVACINVEALSHEYPAEWAYSFVVNHHAIMIVDESTSIKNQSSKRTRAVMRIGANAEYRRIATGTPITECPLDLYAQCQFLCPGSLGHNSFHSFKGEFALERRVVLPGNRQFNQVIGYRGLDKLSHRLSLFTSRITKEECLDLPEKVYEQVYVEMTPEQQRIYGEIRDEAVTLIGNEAVTVTEALAAVEKLHQVCCGHVRSDDNSVIDLPNNRIGELLRLREIVHGKMIVWCAYQRDVQLVYAALAEWHERTVRDNGYPTHYYGLTRQEDRINNLRAFHDDPNCLELVGTAATGGKGITLNESSYVVYYSNTYRLEHRLQSEDRNHRIGQTRHVTYVDLVCRDTVDEKILRALKKKEDLAREVLDTNRLMDLLS